MLDERQIISSLIENVLNNDDCTREFEIELTKFVNGLSDDSVLISLFNSKDDNEKFLGIYGLFIYYIHMMEYDKLESLIDSSERFFSNHKCLGHLKTIYYINSDTYYTFEELLNHLDEAYDIVNSYKKIDRCNPDKNINVAGCAHAFADLFVTYCERYEAQQEELVEKWYKRALMAVDIAIQLSPGYAKYYCTRGRILSQKHLYEEALSNIQKAICMESPDSNKDKYSLRIMQYQSHKLNVQARFQIYKLNTQQKIINEDITKMKDTLMSNVETIGFFAGIISFVIGSLTLADGQTAKDAAALILVLLGTLLVVFDSFSFLLHIGKKNMFKHIFVLIAGILVMLGGLFLVL